MTRPSRSTAETATARKNAQAPTRASSTSSPAAGEPEGWHGWDEYAAFYDWENARTVGRRDVAFWRTLAQRIDGRTLELGCGTGRVLLPLARAGVRIVGIDRSVPMLARAQARLRRLQRTSARVAASLIRGDIRQLPFHISTDRDPGQSAGRTALAGRTTRSGPGQELDGGHRIGAAEGAADGPAETVDRLDPLDRPHGPFDLVIAPYGILQSLVRDRDLTETLQAVSRVLAPGGTFGLDLVPDVPRWQEYSRRISLRGRRGPRGTPVTLIESVRQDSARRLTIFDQEFVEGRGAARRVRRFSLTFRTVGIQPLRRRLERAGFRIDGVLGGYDGAAWDPRADVWVVLASKR